MRERKLLCLSWVREEWRYASGLIRIKGQDFAVGKARAGAFYIARIGEAEWRIAPVKYPGNKREPIGNYYGFILLTGAPPEVNCDIERL